MTATPRDVPPLAAVRYQSGFPIDEFIGEVSCTLRAQNFRVGGVVQENERNGGVGPHCVTMSVVVLRTGERLKISQDLGVDSRGCRLDARGLAEAESRLDPSVLDPSLDLIILNKFGRAEIEGRGLRTIFASAIETGLPVLTAVRPPYDEVWRAFHGGMAADLSPRLEDVMDWCRAVVSQKAMSSDAR